MKKLVLIASAFALIPGAAQAQLLGGGGLGGSLNGTLGGTLGGSLDRSPIGSVGSTLDRTTRTVRGAVDASGSTSGSQSVDAQRGTVRAERSANGSLTGSTASLADLVVPPAHSMGHASAQGSASGHGRADAQLIGTDALRGTLAPVKNGVRSAAEGTASSLGTANLAGGQAAASGNGSGTAHGSFAGNTLALAGSAAAAGEGVASVKRGMPVLTEDGASLGKVRGIIADGRGEVQQIVVKQGKVTRELPAGMFSASGNALVAADARADAAKSNSAATGGEAH